MFSFSTDRAAHIYDGIYSIEQTRGSNKYNEMFISF